MIVKIFLTCTTVVLNHFAPTISFGSSRTLKHRRGQKTLHTSGLEWSVAPSKI